MIPSRCIEMSTKKGDIVVDPFGGGGSTFEAAELAGRYWIGTEITDCSIIRERFDRQLPASNRVVPAKLRRAFVDADETLSFPIIADHR